MSKKRAVAEKILLPLVAAGTSAAAGAVAKKAPALLENTVLPRLREWARDAGGAAEQLPGQAKSAVESTGDLATQLTSRARSVVSQSDPGGGSAPNGSISDDELRERSKERAKRRAKRRNSKS